LEQLIHLKQRIVIAAGDILKYMPADSMNANGDEMNCFCLTGQIEDGDDDPKNWIRLCPASMTGQEMTDRIIVEDGKIFIEVLPNPTSESRTGIVHLATVATSPYTGSNTVKRIKISIMQLGQ
jgi:hypothetical protein